MGKKILVNKDAVSDVKPTEYIIEFIWIAFVEGIDKKNEEYANEKKSKQQVFLFSQPVKNGSCVFLYSPHRLSCNDYNKIGLFNMSYFTRKILSAVDPSG